ncbi:glycosyltransferase family 1 protein [Rhodococcus ruber]|nr:glycosyltransferase family 1 protein [Rhodococcus ruber]
MTREPQNPPVIVLSTADFKAPVWTNKQHIASRLAQDRDVYYVNSMGLRTPNLNSADARRIAAGLSTRIKHATRRFTPRSREDHTCEPGSPRQIDPQVIPVHTSSVIRRTNRALLRNQLRRIVPDIESAILWTFSPLTYGIEDLAHRTIYHSVDLLHKLHGVPSDLILAKESQLVAKVDAIVASSVGVRDHLQNTQRARSVRLWENVADFDGISSVTAVERRPKAIFAGNLTPQKVDFVLLQNLADSGVELAIAGPRDVDGTKGGTQVDALLRHRNVHYLGNLGPAALANALNSATVGLIPYVSNGYTNGVFPMKVYEYLAAGLAVVATPLPSLANISSSVEIADRAGFLESVKNNIQIPHSDVIASRQRTASANSWSSRMRQIESLIGDLTCATRP